MIKYFSGRFIKLSIKLSTTRLIGELHIILQTLAVILIFIVFYLCTVGKFVIYVNTEITLVFANKYIINDILYTSCYRYLIL